MERISRRDVLKGVTAASIGGIGVAGTESVAANDPEDIIGRFTGSGEMNGDDEGDGCQRVVSQHGDGQYSTIQAALDDANPGDNVCVFPGTYEEQLTVDTADIVLAGIGSADDIVVRSGGTTIDVTGDRFFLFKFTVENTSVGGTAIAAGFSTGMRRSNVTVIDGTGVETTSAFSAVDNTFRDAGLDSFTGVGIESEGVIGRKEDKTDGTFIARNSFDEFRHGIRLTDCEGVAIRDNTLTLNRYDGVRIRSTPNGPTVRRYLIDGNEFRDNGLGMVLFEKDSARIELIFALENVFDNFTYGIYTSTRKIPFDIDSDGETEPTPAPGPLDGGVVHAQCNYWGVPTGPNAEENEFSDRNFLTRRALPNGDKVTEGVDYTPWQTQPQDMDNETTCVGGTVTSEF